MKGFPGTRLIAVTILILLGAALVVSGSGSTPPGPNGGSTEPIPPLSFPQPQPAEAFDRQPYPMDRVQTMPDKVRQAWTNLITLDAALAEFYMWEGRFPRNLDELLNSDEMPVRPADLINPYTGKPVRATVNKSLGDVRYVYKPDALDGRDVHLEVYLDLSAGENNVETLKYTRNYLLEVKTLAEIGQQFAAEDRWHGADRRMWFICRAISTFTARVTNWHGTTPRTFAETMRKYDWWLSPNIKNPYTGAPIEEVSAPSAGNFTFAGIPADPRNPASEYGSNYIICYDSRGDPMYRSSGVEYSIARYLELEPCSVPPKAALEFKPCVVWPQGAKVIEGLPSGVTFKKRPK